MYLREAGVGEKRAFLEGPPGRRDVATLRVGRKEKNISITARCQDDRISRMSSNLTRNQVARDDAFGMPINHDHIQHLGARKHSDRSQINLTAERLVRAEQQ